MTDEQADELLRNNEWSKWSDARDLLQEAAHIGYLDAADELTRLRAEVEALRADAERLDWLQIYDDGFHNIDRISATTASGFNRLPTIRAAIDAARGK